VLQIPHCIGKKRIQVNIRICTGQIPVNSGRYRYFWSNTVHYIWIWIKFESLHFNIFYCFKFKVVQTRYIKKSTIVGMIFITLILCHVRQSREQNRRKACLGTGKELSAVLAANIFFLKKRMHCTCPALKMQPERQQEFNWASCY